MARTGSSLRSAHGEPATGEAERPLLSEADLQALAGRLVAALDPEEVILFGSYAYGTPKPESDVDLLILMETDLPRRERDAPVRDALRGSRGFIQPFVRTPDEIRHALAIGDFFIKEIVMRGRVLYARGPLCHPSGCDDPLDLSFRLGGEVNEVTDPLAWVERAEEDYVTAQIVLRRKVPITTIACFHSQQCVEKYLKAALVARGQGFPKIHELPEIGALLEQHGIFVPLDKEQLEALSKYAVDPRYPGHEPILEEARAALQLARTVRRFVRRLLGIR